MPKVLSCLVLLLFLAGCSAHAESVEPYEWRASDGAILRGSLHFPSDADSAEAGRSERRYPLAVIVSGSGRGPSLEAAVVAAHARELSRRGYAVLTYDKRGTGASDGDFPSSFNVMADDLNAGLTMLAEHRRLDTGRTAIIAISQGWWIALIAVDRGAPVRGMVGIGAPSVSPVVQQEHVLASEMRANGASEHDIAQAQALWRDWARLLRGDISRETYGAAIARVSVTQWYPPLAEQFEPWQENTPYTIWYQEIMDFDPMPLLARSTIPVVIFQGENDAIVSPDRSRSDYAALSARGVPVDFRLVLGASHDLSSRFWFLPRQWRDTYWAELDAAMREAWTAPPR